MTLTTRRTLFAALLVTAAVVWLLVNKPWEGPVLLHLGEDHGLTVGDLPSLAALGVAGWLVLRRP